jgi:hypothetical protein
MTAPTTPAPATATARGDRSAATTLQRLSQASVDRHFDAYLDVDWDSAGKRFDLEDPGWTLPSWDPLARTAWYQALPPRDQHALALARYASMVKIGWQFENVLQRGLLYRSLHLPDDDPSLRYVQHEIAEETQHTLMFQEFVRRCPVKADGIPWPGTTLAALFVVPLARRAPAAFFVNVLGGEDPVDFAQRRLLRDTGAHPLLEQIMRIHVAEEARHLSYARLHLSRAVPKLGPLGRLFIGILLPIVMGTMARMMLLPTPGVMRRHHVPRPVRKEAYTSPEAHQLLRDSVAKPRTLARELGLMTPVTKRVWKALGVYAED